MTRSTLRGAGALLVLNLLAAAGHAQDPRVLPVPIHARGKALVAPRAAAAGDTFPLTLLASVEYSDAGGMAFGDTDHDGANELIFAGGWPFSYRIWEHQGGNAYTLEDSGATYLITYAMGDTDQDGRSEIIGQSSGYVQVIESVDIASHPSQLVWSSPYLSNMGGYATIGDTDRDGRMEILQSKNSGSARLVIFENTGDNAFSWAFEGTLSGATATGEKLIADLDGDGKLEIALCGSPGWLHIFESPANDTWVLTTHEWTGLWNAYSIAGGSDTDGNGKPEVFVMGTLFTATTSFYSTVIYESAGNDSFVQVATLVMDEGIGSGSSAVCDVDGDGVEEYLMRTSGIGIRIFRARMPATWDCVSTAFGPGGGVYTFDLNRNGLPEVIWQYSTTRIFEHPGTPTGAGPGSARLPARLEVVPNPCRVEATLRFAARGEAPSTLAVFDVRGRVVERRKMDSSGPAIRWQPAGLPTGVYLVRLESESGRVIAAGRGMVVR